MEHLVLINLASTEAYSSSQIYSQCCTRTGEKNDCSFGTEFSNRTSYFFFTDPKHVEILLTTLIGDQYDSKKPVLVSLFKKIVLHGNRPKLGILWSFSNIGILMKKRDEGPYLWLNKMWIQPSTGQKRKNYDICNTCDSPHQ